MIRSDAARSIAFITKIERIKLLGQTEPNQLKTIAESIEVMQMALDYAKDHHNTLSPDLLIQEMNTIKRTLT